MSSQYSFGDWLKRRRKALDLTQAELARQVGCSAAAIRKIEAEERRPSAQIVERMADIFSIDPGERAAFLRFARGGEWSAPAAKAQGAPWQATSAPPRSNLPTPATSLIGREQELAALRAYLLNASNRLVTLVGPPGTGKTRLSIQGARQVIPEFPDGVFFVALAPLADASLIVPTIIQTLGFAETKRKPPLARLQEGIGDRHMLLVLDNLEHIIEGAAPLISDLLLSCPHLKILTTSREALKVSGEWIYPVPPLTIPPATQWESIETEGIAQYPALALFAERARAVRPDFRLTPENLPAVASICARLDGLPLAIELIAARIRLMSPQILAERLSGESVLSSGSIRAPSARQRTLADAIGWSYDLLSAEEKQLFTCLSVFSGGFRLDAVESVFSQTPTDQTVSDLVVSLLDKSLLVRSPDADGEPRLSMLMMVQQFALDRLRRMGAESEVRDRHLDYFLSLAEQADKEIHGPHQVEWADRLRSDHDNLRAALDWCTTGQKTESALRLLGALSWPWTFVQGQHTELRNWFDRIHALPDVADYRALYARLHNHIGRQNWLFAEFQETRNVLQTSQAIWQELGSAGETGLAEALVYLGMTAQMNEGDYASAQSFYEQSLKLYQKHGDRWGMAFVLFNLGSLATGRDEDELARQLIEQGLDLFSELGDLWGIGRASQRLGEHFLRHGDYARARVLFEEHLRIDSSQRFTQGILIGLGNLVFLYRFLGDYARAEQLCEQILTQSREHGVHDWGVGVYSLAMIALQQNNYALAKRHFIDNFHLTRKQYAEKISASDLLLGLAAVAAGSEEPERAAKLTGAAEAILATTDYRNVPFDVAEFERHIGLARAQLGEEAFEAKAAEGRRMTLQQAVQYALGQA